MFANKTDVEGCMTEQEILSVSSEQKIITKTLSSQRFRHFN